MPPAPSHATFNGDSTNGSLPARLNELPPAEQAVWKSYPEKSLTTAAADHAAVAAEIAANNLPGALKAPSGGDFKLSYEPGQSAHYVATFDNNSTTAEMDYLANVGLATKRDDCKAAFLKRLNCATTIKITH